MAIDKTRTSKGMKIGVIVLIVAFVASIGGIGSLAFLSPPDAPGASGTTASDAGLQQISQTSSMASIAPNEQALKANPNDYALLKTLGDQYFDYALKVSQAAQGSGIDVTIWQRATDYYRKALAVTPGDPAVGTDMAITQYYGNDVTGAIATIESVMSKSATFAPAPYNAGIFYRAAGDSTKAKAAFEASLKLDPNGPNAVDAKKNVAELGATPLQTAPASTPATK